MSTITTATIQSMLARNARDIGCFEADITYTKDDIVYWKNEIKANETDAFAARYISSCVEHIQGCYKNIGKSKKQIKLLAAIQRQLKDEIRDRKAYNVALKAFWQERNA